MKRYYFTLLLVFVAFLGACVENSPEPKDEIKGSFIKRSECNPNRSKIEIGKNQECISYSWENNTLSITHYNAGFNCCPGDFGAVRLSLDGSTIILDETKVTGDCHCLCLFDVEYKIENVLLGKYEFKVLSNTGVGEDTPLAAVLDLNKEKTGTFCEERNSYPWNM